MQTIVYLFFALLYLSPLVLFVDSSAVLGILLLALALALILITWTIPPGEAQFFRRVISSMVCIGALPAAYMIFQILPLPMVAHPVWQSTANALGWSVPGSISVDKGATLLAFCRYCAFCAVVLLSAALGVNRLRAESILVAMLFAATAVVAFHLLANLGWSPISALARLAGRSYEKDDLSVIACFGLILSLAFVSLVHQDEEAHRLKEERNLGWLIPKWTFALASTTIFVTTLLRLWSGPIAVAIAAGLIAFGFVVLVRRLGLWVGGAPAATAMVVGIVLVAGGVGRSDLDVALRFAPNAPAKLETAQRMVEDAPIFGTGAGTFDEVLQLYRSLEDSRSSDFAAPFAAVIRIEMGRIFLWTSLGVLCTTVALFVRAAIRRGRDWIYPAAVASCLMIILTLAFAIPAYGGPIVFLLSATILGLGLAQSRSRNFR